MVKPIRELAVGSTFRAPWSQECGTVLELQLGRAVVRMATPRVRVIDVPGKPSITIQSYDKREWSLATEVEVLS